MVAIGLSPALASATVHLAEVGTTLASGASHWRFGNVDWRVVRRIGIPGAIGAFAGATVLSRLSTEWARPWTSSILLVLGVLVLLRFAAGIRLRVVTGVAPRRRALVPLGLVAGFVDATGGGGWGPIATPTLLTTSSMEPRRVIGSVNAAEFMVALSASAGFALGLSNERIPLNLVAALLVGGLIAAPIAGWLVSVLPVRVLGVAAGGLVLLTNVRTLAREFDVPLGSRTVLYVLVWALVLGALAWTIRAERRQRAADRAALALAVDEAVDEAAVVQAEPATPDSVADLTAARIPAPRAAADVAVPALD
jgi:hypothetical protein